MSVESLFPRLEPLLPAVQKPIQYVGGELNSSVKGWDEAQVRWALMYPDAYEVGLPNQGVQILYELLNERDGVLAERTYSVWPDLEALMRAEGIPQFTVDAHRPVRAFDDGSKVYIEFPGRIDQGETPPLFVVGPTGDNELVNYRVRRNYYIVDRLFAAAELRLGQDPQQVVRISRDDGVQNNDVPPETSFPRPTFRRER